MREKEGGLPRAFKMNEADQRYFKEHFNSPAPESRISRCKDSMFHQLNKLNMVDAAELKSYIDRIVGDMDKDQLAGMEKAPLAMRQRSRTRSTLADAALPGDLQTLAGD